MAAYDRASIKKTIAAVTGMCGRLEDIRREERELLGRIDRSLDAMRREGMKEVLEGLQVEELNRGRHGIRVSALHEVGVHTLWQAYSMSLPQLVRVNGIGEAGARKIKEIAGEFAESARESVRIRLKTDNPPRAQTELIGHLYVLLHSAWARQTASSLLDGYAQAISAAAREAAPLSGMLSRLLTFGRKKEQAEQAYLYLRDMEQSAFMTDGEAAVQEFSGAQKAGWMQKQQDFEQNAASYIALLETLSPADAAKEASGTGLSAELIGEINAMEVDLSLMKATLRPYQLFGCKYALHQGRVLLGDEMGLGKTVQAIAAMAATAAGGVTHFMVVCPAGVLINWQREIVRHSEMKAIKIHGADEAALDEWMQSGGVAVTTYESISRFSLPEEFRFGMLVADEAHYVKNPGTRRTQAMQKLITHTDRALFMSGTPLENRVEEMCFLIGLLNEELAQEIRQYTNLATAQQFREKISPVYLRRTRENVLTELPDLIETREWCELGKEEAKLYRETVMEGNFAAMRQVSWQAETSLSSKAARLMELCQEAEEDKRKVIIFSFFLKTVDRAASLLGERCAGVITGAVSPEERQDMIDRFRDAPDGSALVCQVQAGGTGLNIQTASVIIFCEPQLKPSIEHQAVGRAYRMGQVRDVMVHRLLCDDTIDERILEILENKQTQFDHFADESAAGEEMMKLDEKQVMKDIIRAEQERLSGAAEEPVSSEAPDRDEDAQPQAET